MIFTVVLHLTRQMARWMEFCLLCAWFPVLGGKTVIGAEHHLQASAGEREADTSKASEDILGRHDDAIDAKLLKEQFLTPPPKNRKGGPDFFHFHEITTRP